MQSDSFSSHLSTVYSLIQQEHLNSQDLQRPMVQMINAAPQATSAELADAVAQLAKLMSQLSLTRAAFLAVGCGALIERGAPPEIAADTIVAAARSAFEKVDPPDASSVAVLDMLATATLAVAMRLTPIRHQLAQDAAFVALCERDRQQSGAVECLLELFQVLDNESIIVLHPESGQGYRIIINGIGKNFELHTLLADAVLGDPAKGRIPGERPDPRVVAAAKDGSFPDYGEDDDDFPSATSTLNLWNWTGIRSDGTLPINQREVLERSEHFIWNEGIPADIRAFEGQRIILLSHVNFSRSWNAGRYFPGMKSDLQVVEMLSPEVVRDLLQRLSQAAAS